MLRSTMPVCTFNGAANRVDHAAKFDDRAVAGALDDAAMVHGDCGVDEVAPKATKAREGPVLVGASEPAISDNIRNQDRSQLSGLAHYVPPAAGNIAQLPAGEG
jgi:hypothetical protein